MDITAPTECLDSNTAEPEMDEWAAPMAPMAMANCELNPSPRKVSLSAATARLLFLAVEYQDPSMDYPQGSFSTFEPGPPFSPHPSTSLSDFERVSPLDPNLNSAASYSHAYGSLDVSTTEEELSEALQSQATQSREYEEVVLSNPICLIHQYSGLPPPGVVIEQVTNDESTQQLKSADSEETNQVLANITSDMFTSRADEEDDLQMVAFDAELEAMKVNNTTIDMLLCDSDEEGELQLIPKYASSPIPFPAKAECDPPEGKVRTISDKPVPLRSRATLPALYLVISRPTSTNTEYGVFARRTIPNQTQFGPIEGILSRAESVIPGDSNNLQLTVEDESGNMFELDTSDENCSNWMRFVRCASNKSEQNLVLSQQGTFLYFTTMCAIQPCQELLVWYSQNYALKRGLATLQAMGQTPLPQESGEEFVGTWPCFQCKGQFPSSEDLQKHLNSHDLERKNSHAISKAGRSRSVHAMKKRKSILKKYSQRILDKHEKELYWYQCSSCHRRFSLKRYRLTSATSNGNHRCFSCRQRYLLLTNSLKLKQLEHKQLRGPRVAVDVVKCDVASVGSTCYNNNNNKHRTRGRKIRGIVNPAKPCKCELCYKAFATDDRLQRHMLVHGAEDSKPLQCKVCFKRFLNNSALSCHVKVHSEKKMFECPICKSIFDQVLALKEHVRVHACDGVYPCPQCSKQFDEYCLIRKHIRAFHCDRKHSCVYCFKLFPTLDKLRMHMLRHSDHREFLCADCGKQFKRKDKLKEHMKRMHSAERELRITCKPARSQANKTYVPKVQVSPLDYNRFTYKCHMCLLGFKRRGMLVNHLAKRHPDISPDSVPELNLPILKTTRDYYCQYCEKVYKSSSKRKAHILKNHPGAELPMSNRRKGGVPVIPGIPNPTFSQTVGSVTTCPHGCTWCHKQYASKAKLLQHQRKKHLHLLSPTSRQVSLELGSSVEHLEEMPDDNCLATVHSITVMTEDFVIPLDDLDNGDATSTPIAHIKVFGGSDLLTQAMSELTQSLGREFSADAENQYHEMLSTDEYTPH